MSTIPPLPTLLHYLSHWSDTTPEAIYLSQPQPDGRVLDLTWREVNEQARRMATHLQALQLPAGSSIAIFGKNSAHWIVADLAIALAGHVSVPIYPTASAATLAYVLEHSESRLLFVGRLEGGAARWTELRDSIPAHLPMISLPLSERTDGEHWDAIVARTAPLRKAVMAKPETLATIIYTSGSTGHPKGVMHSFGTMMSSAAGMGEISNGGRGTSPADRLISYLPLAHVAERLGVEATSLRAGCRVYFNDRADTFIADLRRFRPTLLFSVPRLWIKFQQGVNQRIPPSLQRIAFAVPGVSGWLKRKLLAELGLDQVHTAYAGSAALPAAVLEWYRNLGLELLEGFGMSENFGNSHFSRSGRVRVGYVGECNPGVECRLAEDGEILVKSPGQMLGYYKRPELMVDCYTVDGFFRTGDRGEMDERGRLRITGRVKELFKTSKGKYIAPVPLEMKLAGNALIEDACVTGVGLAQPLALVTLSEAARKSLAEGRTLESLGAVLEELLVQINASVEGHERMDRLVVVRDTWTIDNGMLTPTLKIRRSIIEEHYAKPLATWARAEEKVLFA